MDTSRRAVESYWRSKMVDGVTAEEDKVAPVYKLEDICELLRSSHASIVKEVSDIILKRLDHKSPIVKQKALRLIKYSVGKSGNEFKREMQRHSAVIRQLFHYKGNLDPLKGDALNKAVRDTAHEAITAIFAEDSKPAPAEDLDRRIQGFGNPNFEMQTDGKKSFLSEVVGIGSASIRQGLSTFTSSYSMKKNDNGSYKSPNLRKSLTTEIDSGDRYDREQSRGSWGTSEITRNTGNGSWSQDSKATTTEVVNGAVSSHTGVKSREERLLETIVTSGGVRLQPTRDALQAFLVEASKLDALALSHAIESKLQSTLWQVRMKAACVLESILRKKDDTQFSMIASYFSENIEVVIQCSESPQSSLREKANKVLNLLDGDKSAGEKTHVGTMVKAEKDVVHLPDLIDTGYDDDYESGDSTPKQTDLTTANVKSPSLLVDDLLGESLINDNSMNQSKKEDDPFADVSFHSTVDKGQSDDLFSGLTVDEKQGSADLNIPTNKQHGSGVFDIFSQMQDTTSHQRDMNDLMADLSINVPSSEQKLFENLGRPFSEVKFSGVGSQSTHRSEKDSLNNLLGSQENNLLESQAAAMNPTHSTPMFPLGAIQYNIPPNFMFNQAQIPQAMSYNTMASLIAQQQLLATMNFQQMGSLSAQGNVGGSTMPIPDVFHVTNNPISSLSTATTSKKEETKAFDFIADHLSTVRDTKRLI